MSRLEKKTALVTGGGNGIGKAMAIRLAKEGADVIVADIDGKASQEVARQVRSEERKSLALEVDVSRQKDIDRMIASSLEAMGKIDILMNNAGVQQVKDMLEITEADWDLVCNVNLRGAFFVMQAVARQMIREGKGPFVP